MTVDNRAITQLAIVVEDIEKTIDYYVKAFDLERPKVEFVPSSKEIPTFFQGKLTNMSDVKIAVFRMGDLVVELTEPGESDSPWKKFLETFGQGVHHVGILVKDLSKAHTTFEELGAEVEHVGFYPGLTYSFVEAQELFGVNFNIKAEIDNASRIEKIQTGQFNNIQEALKGGTEDE